MKYRFALAAPFVWLLLTASVAPEALPVRRANFFESHPNVLMKIRLDPLLRMDDRNVMETVSSGFSTRLVFHMVVYKWDRGRKQPIDRLHREIDLHWDPWKQVFVLLTRDEGSVQTRREFKQRDQAVNAAVDLSVPIAKIEKLNRGKRQYYFVHVSAARNPFDIGKTDENAHRGRGQGGGISVFSRWVSLFVGERPTAEHRLEFRTNYFYLESK